MEAKKTILKNLLEQVAAGQLSSDDAYKLIFEADKPAAKKKAQQPRGRPVGATATRSEKVLAIAAIWVLFNDKMPKMKLRGLICAAFRVEDSYVSKVIARLNKLEKAGHFLGRGTGKHAGTVFFLSPEDMAAHQSRNLEIIYRDYNPETK